MGIVEEEGGFPVFDTVNLIFFFFCQVLKLLPRARVKSLNRCKFTCCGGVKAW